VQIDYNRTRLAANINSIIVGYMKFMKNNVVTIFEDVSNHKPNLLVYCNRLANLWLAACRFLTLPGFVWLLCNYQKYTYH